MCLEDYRKLARVLETPPMFVDVLPLLVNPDEVDVLLRLSEKDLSVPELSRLLGLSQDISEMRIKSLFLRGFLKKSRGIEPRYSLKHFHDIIGRYLGEARTDAFGKYVAALANYRIEERVKQAKADPYPKAKVLPVPEAVMEPVTVVLSYETAFSVLEKANSISIRNCECRVTYGNCDKPLRTCLAIGDFSDDLVERGVAEEISIEEAKEILKIANEHGLVLQALYTDWLKGEIFDLCSCCPCCCLYLRTYMNYGVKHHIAKSGLVAKVETEKCIGCGACLKRCIFQARKLENEKSVVIEENCHGCGLCTTTCPTGATKLSQLLKVEN